MRGDDARRRRSVRLDDRGVSPVIGVVLMVALGMLVVAMFQTTAIPAINAQHEYQHNQRVQTDLVRMESTVDRVAVTGTGETAPVETGLRYPPRLVFVNPPPATGTVRTTEQRTVTIDNATAAGETGDYWNGTGRTFSTRALVYEPSYNEYSSAPTTVYEPWAVYNRDGDQTLPLTETDLVEGRQISLVALDGRVSQSDPGTVGLNIEPTSAPVQTVTVRNETGPITITLSTDIRRDVWEQLLADELDPDGTDPDAYVTSLSCAQAPPDPCGELTLTLEPGSYDLRLGEVAVGSGASRENATYLTDLEGNATSVTASGRQRLVVQARDRFDNPVSGVTVSGSLGGDDGTLRAVAPTTDERGRAVFVYEAPETVDEATTVTVELQFGDGAVQRTVTFDVRLVTGASGTAGGGSDSAAAVTTVEGSVDSQNIGGADRGREASFRITADEQVTITGFTVFTQNELEGRPFEDVDSTFGGQTLPVTFDGEILIALRDIDFSSNLPISGFVDPAEADIVVILEFADGSTKTIGLG